MPLSLSTRWNAHRHADGEPLVEEILALGLGHIELGYDLTVDLVPGVRRMVESGAVRITSVHNFCPVPMGVSRGHPELFVPGSRYPRMRDSAVFHIRRTAEFAASVGAGCMVVHGGNVRMWPVTPKLIRLAEEGRQYEPRYEKLKQKALLRRERKAPRDLAGLYAALEQLLPALEQLGVRLALENLPSWEAIPTEAEMETLARHFNSPWLGYWHDVGHGQVRENLGFVACRSWLERLQPWLAGMHVHDVIAPAGDHVMPGFGAVDFAALRDYARPELPLVIEPAPGTPPEALRDGIAHVRAAWDLA